MAYGNNGGYSGNKNRVAAKPMQSASATATGKAETVFKTGLWKKEGGKSLASVQVKEAITIPAGSYLNLFENDKKNDKGPDFTISVRTGTVKG